MNKYFNPVERIELYSDTIGDKGYVELWSGWNSDFNKESRAETITTVASLSYGNEAAKDPDSLIKVLENKKHLVPFEFVRFSDEFNFNLRNFNDLNYMDISPNEHGKRYFAHFKFKIPLFADAHFMTHRCYSRLAMSRRFTSGDKVPFEFYATNGYELRAGEDFVGIYNMRIKNGEKKEDARSTMPVNTYTVRFACADKYGLKNFFKQRLAADTQKQTRELAEAMLKLLQNHQPELYQFIMED